MSVGRFFVSAISVVALASCGGGGSSGNSSSSSGGSARTPTPTQAAQCTVRARQNWALEQIRTFYLFPNLLDTSVNPANYSDVQSYIDALTRPAATAGRDQGFTFITSIEEEERQSQTGETAGFGFLWGSDESNRIFILEAYENAPAFAAGFDRGVEITAINGQSVATLRAQGTLFSSLGPPTAGVTRTFQIRDLNGVTREVTITKAVYNLDPVSDRFGVRIFDDGGRKVGYLALRTFLVRTAEADLRAAFAQFKAAGVTEIILDLRYNGGGFVFLAELLGDLMARDRVGQVFGRTEFSPSQSANNTVANFKSQPEAINVTKLAVIGTEGTASASELVANAFIPYLGNNLALIGSNTLGKPIGQIAVDRPICDDRLRVIAFRTVNANGGGDYYNGLADVVPNFCRARDDFNVQFGNAQEDSIATALDFLAGRGCPTTANVPGQQSVRSVADKLKILQPENPTPVQRDIPGLF